MKTEYRGLEERVELCDWMGVQSGEQGGIAAILFDELEVLVGNLNFVVWNLRRKVRRKNDFLLLLPHRSVR